MILTLISLVVLDHDKHGANKGAECCMYQPAVLMINVKNTVNSVIIYI